MNIIIMLLLISFLILIHELGHFMSARALGIKVDTVKVCSLNYSLKNFQGFSSSTHSILRRGIPDGKKKKIRMICSKTNPYGKGQ